jgi:hypothetical protein
MRPHHVRLLVVPAAGAVLLGGVLWLSGIPLSNAGGSDDGVQLVSEGTEATLVVTDLDPGESASRSVSISNPGSEPTRLSMTEHGDAVPTGSGSGEDGLQLVVEREGVRLYAGPMGAMSDVAADQGWIAAGSSVSFTFTVSLPDDAPPLPSQASLSYTWETAT